MAISTFCTMMPMNTVLKLQVCFIIDAPISLELYSYSEEQEFIQNYQAFETIFPGWL